MVNTELLHPQEVEVLYMIPMIRRYLTLYMKDLKLSQKEIAEKLCVKESTISQYVTQKRASQFDFDSSIKEEIKSSAGRIKCQADLVRETQRLLELTRQSEALCEVHKKVAECIPQDCDFCDLHPKATA